MPVSVPTAVVLQMERRVEVALVLEEAGVAHGVKPGAGLEDIVWMWKSQDSNLACHCAFKSLASSPENPFPLSSALPKCPAIESWGWRGSGGKKLCVTTPASSWGTVGCFSGLWPQ